MILNRPNRHAPAVRPRTRARGNLDTVRRRVGYLLAAALAIAVLAPVEIAHSQPATGPVPSWVTTNRLKTKTNSDHKSKAVAAYYLLSELQENLDANARFYRTALEVLNAEGVSQFSDITIDYDPTYETLTMHKLVVHRDGRELDQASRARFTNLQREANLERKLYDGTVTVSINLSDVRVGDIIEYAYSVVGRHPAYETYKFGEFFIGYGVPIATLIRRITSPRELHVDPRLADASPTVQRNGGLYVYEWRREDVDPLPYETLAPNWQGVDAWLRYTEDMSWTRLRDWALPLFEVEQGESDRVTAMAGGYIELKDDPAAISSAIRFVQDEIRYLGLEIGISAFRPHAPSEVLTRRYGDCKDKSLLLCVLLNQMGAEARPVLVNSLAHPDSQFYFPSPSSFDHCVVTFDYRGDTYYVDPTISHQGGELSRLRFPSYGYGFVVASDSDDLTKLPLRPIDPRRITQEYRLDENGDATLVVTTQFLGGDADLQRAYFAQAPLDQISQRYLEFYAMSFPTIKSAGDMVVHDNNRDGSNELMVEEAYLIPAIWDVDEDDPELMHLTVIPHDLALVVDWETTPNRTMPLQVDRLRYEHEVVIYTPEPWTIDPDPTEISGPGYAYNDHAKIEGKKISVKYEYERTQTLIPPDEVNAFVAKHEEITDQLPWILSSHGPLVTTFRMNWIMLAITIVLALACVHGAGLLYQRYDPEPRAQVETGDRLGGWLILPAFGLILGGIQVLVGIGDFKHYLDAANFGFGTGVTLLFLQETIASILITVGWLLVTICFFKRRSSLPSLYIAYMVLLVVSGALNLFLSSKLLIGELAEFMEAERKMQYRDYFRTVIGAIIWIPYFLSSERVKRTFVVRSPRRQEPSQLTEPDVAAT